MQDNVLVSQYEHFERLYLEDTPYAYVAKRYYRYAPASMLLHKASIENLCLVFL